MFCEVITLWPHCLSNTVCLEYLNSLYYKFQYNNGFGWLLNVKMLKGLRRPITKNLADRMKTHEFREIWPRWPNASFSGT